MTLYRAARIGVITALLLPVASACGGSSSSVTAKTTLPSAKTTLPAATTSTVGTTTTTINPDQTKAKAELLTLRDLPAGWTASSDPASSDSSGFGGQEGTNQLASCLGVAVASLDVNPPGANSPTFTSANQANTVEDQVQVFPTVASAAADFSLFSSPRTPGCMTQVFNGPLKAQFTSQLQPGQTLASVSTAARPFPRIGDHSGDIQITFVVAQSGINVKVFLDLIVIVKGRSETTLSITQPQVLSLPQLGTQLATVAAARMTA